MFEIIHNIHGRLRLRANRLKANGALAREFQIGLQEIAGVRSVEINLLTGSLLILHDGEASTTREIATRLGLFDQPLHNPSQGILIKKVARIAASYLLEAALERLLTTSVAILF